MVQANQIRAFYLQLVGRGSNARQEKAKSTISYMYYYIILDYLRGHSRPLRFFSRSLYKLITVSLVTANILRRDVNPTSSITYARGSQFLDTLNERELLFFSFLLLLEAQPNAIIPRRIASREGEKEKENDSLVPRGESLRSLQRA